MEAVVRCGCGGAGVRDRCDGAGVKDRAWKDGRAWWVWKAMRGNGGLTSRWEARLTREV